MTIKRLDKMGNLRPEQEILQELFSKAVIGLKTQGFTRCANSAGEPLYADDEGRHCPAGWIDTAIPARTSTWFADDPEFAATSKVLSRLTLDELEFVRQMQWCHDESTAPVQMERRIRRLGERLGLDWPV